MRMTTFSTYMFQSALLAIFTVLLSSTMFPSVASASSDEVGEQAQWEHARGQEAGDIADWPTNEDGEFIKDFQPILRGAFNTSSNKAANDITPQIQYCGEHSIPARTKLPTT